jgi:hypothetical protein
LDFQGPGISPEVFLELKYPASLVSLDVSRSRFDDAALMKLVDCPSLRSVTVEETHVTAEGIRRFLQARPGMVIRGP